MGNAEYQLLDQDSNSKAVVMSIGVNQLLRAGLANETATEEFPRTGLGYSLETVSRLIGTRDLRGVDADTFCIEMGGKCSVDVDIVK